jgi:hypothetical protein
MSTDCTFQSSQFFDRLSMHFGVVDYFWASALTTADCRPPSWNQITDKRHAPPLMKRGGWIPLGLLNSYLYTLWSTFTYYRHMYTIYVKKLRLLHQYFYIPWPTFAYCVYRHNLYLYFFFNLGITLNLNWNT